MCGFSCFCSVFLKCKSVDSLAFQAHNVNHFRFYSFPFAVYKLWIFSLLMRFRWFRMLPSNKCIWNTLLLSALDRGGHGRDAFDLLAAPRASQKPSWWVLIEHVQRCCIRLMYGKWGRRWAEREKCAFCWRYSRSPVVPRTCKYVFSSQHVYVPWRRDRYHLWDAGGNKLHQAVRQFVFLYVLYVLNYHWKVWIGPGYVLGRLRVIFACFPGVYFRQRWSPEHSCVNKCINSIFGTLCHSDSKYLTLLTAHKVQIHTESCQTQVEMY